MVRGLADLTVIVYYDIVLSGRRWRRGIRNAGRRDRPGDQMTDTEFARAFERGDVPNADFHHRDHLRLAWTYLAESGTLEEATGRIVAAIKAFAAAAGAARKYHETLTVFWMHMVWRLRQRPGVAGDFDAALESDPGLLDKDLPLIYYSRARLFSEDARRSWLEPDLRPFPGPGCP